jgi:phosphoglycerate kinase
MIRSVRDIKVFENIPVLLRTSLNAPIENGKVTNVFRLKSAVPTIEYLQQRGARVVLISHISGKGTETLAPMYDAMKSMVKSLSFCPVSVGEEARAAVRALHPGQVVMLENLRRNAGEEANDPAFAKELASLADVFVQDSFDVCHRKHASVVGVPEFLPSYAGLTVENEVRELTKAVKPRRPSLAVIAGAKFSTKEPVLKKLLKTYDHVAIGGALANDFIHAKGYSVGASLVSTDGRTGVAAMLKNKNLIVPADVIAAPLTADRSSGRAANVSDIHTGEAALDVGPETAKLISALAQKAKTVLWNGPLGLYEHGFIDATQVLARGIASGKAHSVLGGGDTIAAVEALGLINKFSFVSTGGGAMLDFLAEGTLPGLEALSRH